MSSLVPYKENFTRTFPIEAPNGVSNTSDSDHVEDTEFDKNLLAWKNGEGPYSL